MGSLFEFLAEVIVAFAVAALAQIGIADSPERDAGQAPAVQRTVLKGAARTAPAAVATKDCDERARLRSV
jgi:hypothetical protein